MEKVCKNCRLFNNRDNVCGVTVLIAGEQYELPVLPNDYCHWEVLNKEIHNELENEIKKNNDPCLREKLISQSKINVEINQIRVWSDGKNGYIEYYPE